MRPTSNEFRQGPKTLPWRVSTQLTGLLTLLAGRQRCWSKDIKLRLSASAALDDDECPSRRIAATSLRDVSLPPMAVTLDDRRESEMPGCGRLLPRVGAGVRTDPAETIEARPRRASRGSDRDARNHAEAQATGRSGFVGVKRLLRGWRLALAGRRTRRACRRRIAAANRWFGCRASRSPVRRSRHGADGRRDREAWTNGGLRGLRCAVRRAVTAMLDGAGVARARRSRAANADRGHEYPAPAPVHRGAGCRANRRSGSRVSAAPGFNRRRRGAAPPTGSRDTGRSAVRPRCRWW